MPYEHYCRKMFNQGVTSMRGFRIPTTFGITMQTSGTKKLLVQPTATANQCGCTLGFLTNTTLVRLRILFPTYQLPRVGSSMLRDYGDSGPDSTPDSPWMSSTSSSFVGPGMTGSGGRTAIASS
jgi:hypothetical protein